MQKFIKGRNSLAVQWLGLHAFTVKDWELDTWSGN